MAKNDINFNNQNHSIQIEYNSNKDQYTITAANKKEISEIYNMLAEKEIKGMQTSKMSLKFKGHLNADIPQKNRREIISKILIEMRDNFEQQQMQKVEKEETKEQTIEQKDVSRDKESDISNSEDSILSQDNNSKNKSENILNDFLKKYENKAFIWDDKASLKQNELKQFIKKYKIHGSSSMEIEENVSEALSKQYKAYKNFQNIQKELEKTQPEAKIVNSDFTHIEIIANKHLLYAIKKDLNKTDQLIKIKNNTLSIECKPTEIHEITDKILNTVTREVMIEQHDKEIQNEAKPDTKNKDQTNTEKENKDLTPCDQFLQSIKENGLMAIDPKTNMPIAIFIKGDAEKAADFIQTHNIQANSKEEYANKIINEQQNEKYKEATLIYKNIHTAPEITESSIGGVDIQEIAITAESETYKDVEELKNKLEEMVGEDNIYTTTDGHFVINKNAIADRTLNRTIKDQQLSKIDNEHDNKLQVPIKKNDDFER